MVTHVVALSGGKDSTAMAVRLAEVNPSVDYQFISTPVGNEPPALFIHLKSMEKLIGKPIRFLKPYSGDGLKESIKDNNMIPNWRARFCTRQLKIEPSIAYLEANAPAVQYVGLRADEEEREGIYGDIDGVEQCYPMREWGWTIDDVYEYLAAKDITVPERTNCNLCFFQRLSGWYDLWLNNRKAFNQGIAIEEEMGHTFRSDGRDTWPAALKELGAEFEGGRIPKEWLKMQNDKAQGRLFDCAATDLCRVCTL